MSFTSPAKMYLAASALILCIGAAPANASTYLFQWDDGEPDLIGNTYQDGALIQSVNVGPESYLSGYGLWAGVLVDSFNVAFNIYDPTGTLSDTWNLFGEKGAGQLGIPFLSDVEGQALQPLDNAFSLVETGDWQRVYEFAVSNGDVYQWEFKSDVSQVPIPAAGLMLLGGLTVMGAFRRRGAAK